MKETTAQKNTETRAPIVAVMGHIDHGKSSLLDYIRKTKIVEGEAGGITQHVSAYMVTHKNEAGEEKNITFLDTPGHAAFQAMRERSADISDVVILIIAADDGVKPQTLEAYKAIKDANVPFIVAINKIDKPSADAEKVKRDLMEHEIFVEGLGGSVPVVSISAETGEGIPDLLSLLLLAAELEDLKGTSNDPATGYVLEANLDPKKGIAATLILTTGSIEQGMVIASGRALAPVRIMEDFQGKKITRAGTSTPIRITGWSEAPKVGSPFKVFNKKKDAEQAAKSVAIPEPSNTPPSRPPTDSVVIPIVIKADVSGSIDAIIHEIDRIKTDNVSIKIVQTGIGAISEGDIKSVAGNPNTVVVGFNVKIGNVAQHMAERVGVVIHTFDIIYRLTEWLEEKIVERTPVQETEEIVGEAKIIRTFSKTKDKQVMGGKINSGILAVGNTVNVERRGNNIGKGKILELQQQKKKTEEVNDGGEFGMMIESKVEITEGDSLTAITVVRK
ncbi:translation initiation factor IF-2 [Candidatus Wolfebacteria bacterium]|nr:MAG: translation initiation factor IF-2 [Candidatus Wolfebacteria bacterium]